MMTKKQIPGIDVYKEVLEELEKKDIRCAIICRLAAETSMCRIEIVNARIDHIDLTHERGLDLLIAKKIKGRQAKEGHMRIRCIPLNISLYRWLQENLDFEQTYIIPRIKGDLNKPFEPRQMNNIFYKHELPFTVHQLRHYFRAQVWTWMIENKQPDIGVVKEIMGHKKTVHESYGRYSWKYKLKIVDAVFAKDESRQNINNIESLKEEIANGIIKGITQADIERSSHLFITGWLSKMMGQYRPGDLYTSINNNNGDGLWANLSIDLRMQIRQHKDFFMRLDADTILQFIKKNNLDLYSTLINTPKGLFWIHTQINDIKKQIVSTNSTSLTK